MRGFSLVIPAIVGALTSGCAGQFQTDRAAVEYNRALSNARNEILLLNILRAWAYEPLQFSTVSQVSGSVRANTEISLPFPNILNGGDPAEFGPSVTVSNRNPNVTILPLDTREFVQGINRPIGAQLIARLVAQGWPRATVLTLTIGGVQCGTGNASDVRMNHGPRSEHADRFIEVFQNSTGFNVESRTLAQVNLPAAEALELARGGSSGGLRVRLADPAGHGHEAGQALSFSGATQNDDRPLRPQANLDIEVVDENAAVLTGLDFSRFCDPHARPGSAGQWQLTMRSVQGMIRYLAEVHRANYEEVGRGCAQPSSVPAGGPVEFRIFATCAGARPPQDAAISTFFRGQYFYVPRAADSSPSDETLRIMSMLSELLALQVTEQSVASSRPLIAVSQ